MVIRARHVERPPAAPIMRSQRASIPLDAVEPIVLRPRLDLFGVLIDQIDRATASARISRFLEVGVPRQIVTVNLDFLYLAEQNAEFRATINEADMAVPDGMPLVWLSRVIGVPLAGRITGVELVNESCLLAVRKGVGVFFLGGTPEVASAAAARVRDLYPGLVVHQYAPPFGPISPDEDERIVEKILRARPGFLFVALGAPRQDLWIRAHRERLGVPIAMGVGCVLDLLAGVASRAPTWMQSAGLEWTYRLIREPRRLWRRYLVNDLPLLGRLAVMALDVHRTANGETPDHRLGQLDRGLG